MSHCVRDRIVELTLRFPELGDAGKALSVKSGLTNSDWCILPVLRHCANEYRLEIFNVLDEVAAVACNPGIAARALACVADMLGMMAKGRGGLRSGPGRNPAYMPAFALLEKGDITAGVRALATQRRNWLSTPDSLIRGARHYESSAQILIRHAVMTARQFINTKPGLKGLDDGKWTVVQSGARIDVAGGWSDTPPITYEHGGAVVMAAIIIDKKRPIGAKVRKIADPVLEFTMGEQKLRLTELDQLRNYTQPQSPGALLKAAFCCAEIVSLESELTLSEQLMSKFCGGFEMHTWSNLPQGSGLGTSSILAAVVMAAVWRCAGLEYTNDALIHVRCCISLFFFCYWVSNNYHNI